MGHSTEPACQPEQAAEDSTSCAVRGRLAAAIAELAVAETKRAASVRQSPDAARRLLAALVADPEARLQIEDEP